MRQVSEIVRPGPLHRGDPPPKNAELTVYALGPNQDDIIPSLKLLGEFSSIGLRRFQMSLPCVMTLPVSYYDKSNTFVALLRSSGTKFSIRSWSWMCPQEIADEHHWCNPTCSVAQYEEVIKS